MKKLGSHVSFKAPNYLLGAAQEASSYEADAMMIYLGAPQNTRRADKENMKLAEYMEKYSQIIPKENILVHAPYIVNPASVEKHDFAIEFLIKELGIMKYLGLKQIVLHPGAHTKFTKEEATETLVKSLKTIIKETEEVEILLETMAGKGTELGRTFEELVDIIEKVGSNRIGICLDTCHIWEGGYDLNNPSTVYDQLKASGALKYIRALHVNDSKNEIGAHKDRHANLNTGHIKLDKLIEFISLPEFANIIKVLETPYIDGNPPYKEEIKIIKSNV